MRALLFPALLAVLLAVGLLLLLTSPEPETRTLAPAPAPVAPETITPAPLPSDLPTGPQTTPADPGRSNQIGLEDGRHNHLLRRDQLPSL